MRYFLKKIINREYAPLKEIDLDLKRLAHIKNMCNNESLIYTFLIKVGIKN
jgi:hypothetical protein